MSKNNKIIIIAFLALIAIAGIIYFGGYNYNLQNPPANNYPVNTPPQNNTQNSVQVSIKNFAFDPPVENINKRGTVMWTNNDSAPHRILGDGFQSEILNNGQTYSFTFNAAGTFDYICSIHPYMKGSVVVK